MTGVHRHGEGSAPPWYIRCHRPNILESEGNRVGHRQGTIMPRAVHRPIFQRVGVSGVWLGGH